MRRNILILGGASEASALAASLAARGDRATLSYAGRVERPRVQPVPTRTGGFGGPSGLAAYLSNNSVTHLVDATHPFAARMSKNAALAATETGVPLAAFTRPPWTPETGDHWISAPDLEAAVDALAGPARRIFLAIGKQGLAAFARQPQHRYLLRLVDAPNEPPPLPNHDIVLARGPFRVEDDHALLCAHSIDLVVAKNSGGDGARAKLLTARRLALPVVMIERPPQPDRREFHQLHDVLAWLDHVGADRGV